MAIERLHASELSRGSGGPSTQQYIDVEEVRDGVAVLKNGSYRAILLVSSINFDLKSEEERNLIVSQYQNFLNSLDFPTQILISSRRLNIGPYLEYLKGMEKKQTNELLRFQTAEYGMFIKNLTEVSNIMSKFFYIVVPFSPVENREVGVFGKISAFFNPKQAVVAKRELFETYKNQLWQRVDYIITALSGTGVKLVPLQTEEIIELLYNSYNPNVYTSTVVKNVKDIELKV